MIGEAVKEVWTRFKGFGSSADLQRCGCRERGLRESGGLADTEGMKELGRRLFFYSTWD